MSKGKVLIAGESWITIETHIKGFDKFTTTSYEEAVDWLEEGLIDGDYKVDFIPNHLAGEQFPDSVKDLKNYETIILSDIGANTLLLHPKTFAESKPTPNRLKALEEYVREGGSFCMIGGYLSFQGIEGKGQWKDTLIEKILPVKLKETDDRIEVPEGFVPKIINESHYILNGIQNWPMFLGYNKLKAKEKAEVLLKRNEDPFLTIWDYENGRAAAFASDCAPHWGSSEFVNWKFYSKFWTQLVDWLCKKA